MLSRIDLRGRVPSPAELRAALPRAETDVDAVLDRVRPVVDAVHQRGAEAALDFTEQFDNVRPAAIRVPADELAKAEKELDPAVREALLESIKRARLVHAEQRRKDTTTQV